MIASKGSGDTTSAKQNVPVLSFLALFIVLLGPRSMHDCSKRHCYTGSVRHLSLLEEEAVQAEDFEAAAAHSADLDAAKQLVQRLQHDLRIAEGHLAAMVRPSACGWECKGAKLPTRHKTHWDTLFPSDVSGLTSTLLQLPCSWCRSCCNYQAAGAEAAALRRAAVLRCRR